MNFKSLKAVFAAAALALGLAGCAYNQQHIHIETDILDATGVPLQEHFNHEALTSDFAQSCDVKEDMRSENVRRPLDRNTPDYFQKQDNRLVYTSPRLSDSQLDQVERLVRDIPPHLQDLFYMHGGVWVFSRDSLVEAIPHYGDPRYEDDDGINPFYESYSGLFTDQERRLYLPFHIGDVRKRTVDGETVRNVSYHPLRTNKYRTLHHEFGHFLDLILGLEYGEREHRGRTHHFVETDAFIEAFDRDMHEIAGKVRSGRMSITSYAYFLPETFEGQHIGGDHDNIIRAKRELMAGIWAELMGEGGSGTNFRANFPNLYALLEYTDNMIRQSYEANAPQCEHGFDGHSTDTLSTPAGFRFSTSGAPQLNNEERSERQRQSTEEDDRQHPTKPNIRIRPH